MRTFFLSPVILLLFKNSLITGILPDYWKTKLITPIFKKGNHEKVCYYRPTSKISLISKIFSKILSLKITPILRSVFVKEQHGFRSKRSTITNIDIFKQTIVESFISYSQTDVIFTDFEKAFG